MNLLLAPFSLNVMSIKQLKMACSLEPTMSFIFINIPLFLASKSGTHYTMTQGPAVTECLTRPPRAGRRAALSAFTVSMAYQAIISQFTGLCNSYKE